MARVKFSVIVNELQGSVGSATFQRFRGGTSLRNKPNGRFSRTQFQGASREFMAVVQSAWASLTDPERRQWSSFLSFQPSFVKRNKNVTLTGYNLFLKYNLIRLQAGADVLLLPSIGTLEPLPLEPLINLVGGVLAVQFEEDFSTNTSFILLKISPIVRNITAASRQSVRVVPTWGSYPTGKSDWTLTNWYIQRFGALPSVGNRVSIAVRHWSVTAPIMSQEYHFDKIVTIL